MPNTTISPDDLHTKVSVSLLPIGTIIMSAVVDTKVPTGFLFCNGAILRRDLFADLFAQIGTTYGLGDGISTFGIPDLRGVFPRGAGTSVGYIQNITVALGAKDNDASQDHKHNDNGHNHTIYYWVNTNGGSSIWGLSHHGPVGGQEAGLNGGWIYNSAGYASITGPVTNTGGIPRVANETKPKSLGVNFFIKF